MEKKKEEVTSLSKWSKINTKVWGAVLWPRLKHLKFLQSYLILEGYALGNTKATRTKLKLQYSNLV